MKMILVCAVLAVVACAAQPVSVARAQPRETATNPLIDFERRPFWWIQLFSGNRVRNPDNPGGLPAWWNNDEVDEAMNGFRDRVLVGYRAGARDFVLNRPMGTDGNMYVAGASWLTIPAEKREALASLIRELESGALGEPVRFWPFVGSGFYKPDSLLGWSPGMALDAAGDGQQLGDISTPRRRVFSQITLGGWLSAGVSGLVIDHSAPAAERGHFIDLAQRLYDAHGVYLMGEELPYTRDRRGHIVRNEKGSPVWDSDLHAIPWVILWDRWVRLRDTMRFNPETTRVFVWVQNRSSRLGATLIDRQQAIADVIDRGAIPIINDEALYAYAVERMEGAD